MRGMGCSLNFFAKRLKINAKEYVKVLHDVVKPWMNGVAPEHQYVLQQDGAPAHKFNMAHDWCVANLPESWSKKACPPSSPDCTVITWIIVSVTCVSGTLPILSTTLQLC
jgi:hypothetical protein